ncbi:MAG: thioredoxin [Clostridiaceae bacterium]|jgi:glutaredoxin|nr:thioredoxin family protein [Bacillota bacterium]NLN52066.1 thioredoxin [Clostridiaceae bacterium]
MKKIKMFMFDTCPHCQLAIRCLNELQSQDKYKDLKIEMINERKEPEIADQYDYYYVPTFFVDEEKVHEGHAELEDVQRVLDLALQ